MKVLLINPPRWNELVGKNPAIIEKYRGFNPPLGILYLASAVKKFTDYEIEVLDTQPLKLSYSQFELFLQGKSYDVVGISAMTFTLIDVYKTVKLIKKVMPQSRVILGGTHVHLFPNETINLEGVDFALMGESELSFIMFLENLDHPSQYEKVPGLIYKDNKGQVKKNSFSTIIDLDKIPLPERNLLDVTRYSSLLSRDRRSTTIVTSRGCPFKCSFCDRPLSPITSHFRYRSCKNIIEEVCQCLELGIKDFLFYDDTFTINRKRVLDFCEEIIKRKILIRWDIRTRVDMVDKEMLCLLRKAGCSAIHYGVEAGNDRILKVLNKGFTLQEVRQTFDLTRKEGIDILAYFMIGLPSEKLADIQDTFNLAKELKPDYAHFTIFSPYPATEIYYSGLKTGIIKKDFWREFSENPKEGFRIPVWEEVFKREQLYELIVKLYKSFYLRPAYVLSRFRKIRSKEEFIKKALAGLSVFYMRKDNVDKLR